MAQEHKVELFSGIDSQRNDTDHISSIPVTTILPVLISSSGDAGEAMHYPPEADREAGHLKNLDTNGAGAADREQQAVKRERKRGRPRKNKGDEDLGQSEGAGDLGEPQMKKSRGRPIYKKTELKRSVDINNSGAVQLSGKKPRGRPRKINTPIEDEKGQGAISLGPGDYQGMDVRQVGVTTAHASTAIYNAVQHAEVALNASVVTAIGGTPVQVLPTTAVATVNAIDSSPLRPAPVSVVVSPSVDDASAWSGGMSPSYVITEKRGESLISGLQGVTSPTLLHAEQPKVLNLLPQCVVTNSVISVNLVDRFAEQDPTACRDPTVGKMRRQKEKEECKKEQQQQREDKEKKERKKEKEKEKEMRVIVAEAKTRTDIDEIDSEPTKRKKGQPSRKPEVQPPPPPPPPPPPSQEETPVKRKRGRPPKSNNSLTQSSGNVTISPAATERVGKDSLPLVEERGATKAEPTDVEATTPETETVVKRKRGRPPKGQNPNPPTESTLLPARKSRRAVADSSTVENREHKCSDNSSSPAKRGRPPKSSKVQVQTTESKSQVPIKRRRGRPRKYPIPVVAASGPFLPSVSGITLPIDGHADEEATSDGGAPLPEVKSKQQEDKDNSVVVTPVKRKRGRPPKTPEGPPAKRKLGRPRKTSLPVEGEADEPQQLQKDEEEEQQEKEQPRRKPGRQKKLVSKMSPEVAQENTTSPVAETQTSDPLPKRKRGRPRKIPPVVTTLQEPSLSLSSSADESTLSQSASAPVCEEEDSREVEKLTLQISFSDSDSEHSEKQEVQTSRIMALANRVVPPTPSPPRQLDSPLLDPSFEESYDEDSDPDTK